MMTRCTTIPPVPHLHLSSLPDLPLLRILRFLNESSLKKIRRACRGINHIIIIHRNRLVWRVLNTITIERVFTKDYEVAYNLSVLDERRRRIHYIPNCLQNFPPSMSVFVWLAKIFPNCYIRQLRLVKFRFIDENWERVDDQAMKESKLKIERIHLVNANRNCDTEATIRFVAALGPVELYISPQSKGEHLQSMFRERSAFNFISTLRTFSIDQPTFANSRINFPENVTKIPFKFYTARFFIIPLSTVVKAIRTWSISQEEFGSWRISLRKGVGSNFRKLVTAIDLPYKIMYVNDEPRVVIKNCGGKEIHLRNFRIEGMRYDGIDIVWTIEDDPYFEEKMRKLKTGVAGVRTMEELEREQERDQQLWRELADQTQTQIYLESLPKCFQK